MPTKNTRKLTEQKFNTVAKQLNIKSNRLEDIAAANGLKKSTVKTIRQAGTWHEYSRRKAAKSEQMKSVRALDRISQANQIVRRRVGEAPPVVSAPWWAFWRRG